MTGSTVLATGPMALHARTSVNESSGQRLMLSLPSPFARPSTEILHVSHVSSYVVHREQRVRHISSWVLGVHVWCVCMCSHVFMCVCVCVHVHTKGPFLPMEYVSLLFLCFFLKF